MAFFDIFRMNVSVGSTQTEQQGWNDRGPLGQLEGCSSSPAEIAPQFLQQLGQMGTQVAGMVGGVLMNCMGGCGG